MKKILAIIFPALLIPLLICIDHFFMPDSSKYILLLIYLVFPLIFIIQGITCASSKVDMLIGFLLSTISIIISTSIGYNMGNVIIPIIIYLLLGLLTKTLIKKKSNS